MLYPITSTSNVYKFNVDILVKGESNAATLEKLLHLLHASPDVLDLRIQSGAQMGSLLNLMEAMQQNNMDETPFGKPTATRGRNQSTYAAETAGEKKGETAAVRSLVPESHPAHAAESSQTATESPEQVIPIAANAECREKKGQAPSATRMRLVLTELQIKRYIEQNSLVRLTVNKGKGKMLSIPCRILNYDPVNQLLNVYHVDEKNVYAYQLFEIESMDAHN
ncbi:hypothetical protein WDD9_004770 [Paenibacillus melissococcoides]|uniref:hypothetical protein n=1 Tax=Paenibacillus TaxID=44249 RepID=UPI001B1FEBE8|nr:MULTISPECIES: hypothetical protein [Paenibacillus]MEB9892663.1 hypothetical protein [Bacillus cereus]GIO78510.1 hypothetical protein J6TS7_21200 [Paenibacillus dendritiformis]CAH8716118.1 hypothetical protein HTL2_004497 [Paenibacillus melissococcoides]CAH8717102.1 hypothetical protein WDD9_004770 [Paenibacillus melissococcoides]